MDAPRPFPARIGLGTWRMGTGAAAHDIAAVRHALASGYRLIDTAEMYADGGAERVVGAALDAHGAQHRAGLCIVSKVLPQNASRQGTIRACEASLRHLGCDYLDVYLLHWRGPHPLRQTLQAFDELRRRGLIRHFGISNFDSDDLAEWRRAEADLGIEPGACTNQVYYSVAMRGIEFEQLDWQRRHGFTTMAYSPLGQGELAHDPLLMELAAARGVSAAQLALAWVLRHPDVVAIPKSVEPARIDANLAAADIRLSDVELAQIDARFAPPRRRQPLATS